jgi:predicted ATPase
MMRTLRKVAVKGFKSIASAEIELRDLNVVIGANGSGKSNLIGVFRLLERVLSHNLQLYVASEPDRLLHHGRKVTPALELHCEFDQNAYGFKLQAAQDKLVFEFESVSYDGRFKYGESLGAGHVESLLAQAAKEGKNKIPGYVLRKVKGLTVYHFHDTSDSAPAKQLVPIGDMRALRPDAGNLAACLYAYQQHNPDVLRHVEEHVRLVAPYFDRFVLEPIPYNDQKIKLEWRQKGSDAYFDGYSLSDGTLRFICLATLLLQPAPPGLILLDEPELGLHPYAIHILAEMLQAASKRSQVLLATQSVTLLNQFTPAEVVVAENVDGATVFNRLDEAKLATWLSEFSLGELWEKNVLGGRP